MRLERSSRHKAPEKDAPAINVCVSCGAVHPRNEPRPFEWDSHVVGSEMVDTCSASCRAQAGFTERKVHAHVEKEAGDKGQSDWW